MSASPFPAPILVTGGAGFIGSHVCDALLDQGASVHVFDNLITGKRANLQHHVGNSRLTFFEGNINDPVTLAEAMSGVGAVVHLAALGSVPRSIQDPRSSEAANLEGFLQVLVTMQRLGVRRLVYASSSSVYGDSPDLPKREGREGDPLSPYAVTKVMDEVYARYFAQAHGLVSIGLRFFNVFGERQDPEGPYAAAIPRFIRSFLRHEPPLLHGDGRQTRDFTYVANAVEAVRCALLTTDDTLAGEVFNIAYGSSCDLLELTMMLRERVAAIDPAVATIAPLHGPERAGDVRASLADISKARERLGFQPTVTLTQGLDRTVPWYGAREEGQD
ncbi:MAG TPA: NAD-dependent epimerase/dehydratase family protein [Flavobacteriales bacterium]